MKREDTLNSLQGTIQGEAVIEYVQEIIDKTDTVVGADSLEDIKGRQIAIECLKQIIRRLEKPGKFERGNDYL